MVRYFFGEDTYQARQDIEALAKHLGAKIWWLDKEVLAQRPLLEHLGQRHSLFGTTLPVVRDASALPKAGQAEVAAAVTTEGDWVVWDRVPPDRRSSLFRALKSQGREYAVLPTEQLAQWLVEYVQSQGGEIELPVARQIIEHVGTDRWLLTTTADQLLLTSAQISQSASALLATRPAEGEVFRLLEAMLAGQATVMWQQLQQLLASGASEFYILSMLSYQFRSLVVIRAGLDAGLSGTALSQRSGMHSYAVQKQQRFVVRYRREELLDILTKVLATDFAIKQGKADPRTGLTMLVWSLVERARA